MTDKTEMLPCPFCGGAVFLKEIEGDGEPSCAVVCEGESSCAGSGLYVFFRKDNAGAIAAWNTRAPAAVAAGPEKPVGPDKCPITGRPFFCNVEHPDLGLVATYGGPFDSYTIPAFDDLDNELRCERYDWDADHWIEGGEPVGYLYEEQQDTADYGNSGEKK